MDMPIIPIFRQHMILELLQGLYFSALRLYFDTVSIII